MDLVTLPYALFVFYGALVLGCGGALGFIVGRNLKGRVGAPPPDDMVGRRLRVVEEELEIAQAELSELRDDRDFRRRFHEPSTPHRSEPTTDAA